MSRWKRRIREGQWLMEVKLNGRKQVTLGDQRGKAGCKGRIRIREMESYDEKNKKDMIRDKSRRENR